MPVIVCITFQCRPARFQARKKHGFLSMQWWDTLKWALPFIRPIFYAMLNINESFLFSIQLKNVQKNFKSRIVYAFKLDSCFLLNQAMPITTTTTTIVVIISTFWISLPKRVVPKRMPNNDVKIVRALAYTVCEEKRNCEHKVSVYISTSSSFSFCASV